MSLLANQRARSAVEIIDASVQVLRAHALSLLTISAIVVVPPAVIEAFVSTEVKIFVSLVSNLLFTLGGGAASIYVTSFMTGTEIPASQAFGQASRRFGRIFVAGLGYGLAVILGTFLLVVPAFIFGSRFALATTIAAVEDDTTGKRPLDRSWNLTRGHTMHVLATLGVTILICLIVVFGGAFVIGLLTGALGVDQAMTELLVTPLTLVIAPFAWVVMTLLYIDVRVRVEGADIEAMVAELPRPSAGSPVA
jgi:hypothetical protein